MPKVPKTTWLEDIDDDQEDYDDGWDPMVEIRLDFLRNKREAGLPLNKREIAIEQAGGEELMFADGFDDAIIGVTQRDGADVVVYDRSKVLHMLEQQGMDADEAVEYYEFNIACAYVGPQTPIFVHLLDTGAADGLVPRRGVTPMTEDGKCSECGGTEHVNGYGFAAGGLGSYVMCADCSAVLSHTPDTDETTTTENT